MPVPPSNATTKLSVALRTGLVVVLQLDGARLGCGDGDGDAVADADDDGAGEGDGDVAAAEPAPTTDAEPPLPLQPATALAIAKSAAHERMCGRNCVIALRMDRA
jgi:hypothetical protein